jgi:hypothetical protein
LYVDIPKFANAAASSSSRVRGVNQLLNRQLQGQQALLMDQSNTIQDAQQTILEFKKTTEEMAEDRRELLKMIEGLKADHVAREAEMGRLMVYRSHLLTNTAQYIL